MENYILMKVVIEELKGWSLFFGDLILSSIVTIILGWDWILFAKILLLLTLNFFSIPLLFVFTGFPLWFYYVLILDWIGSLTAVYELKKMEKTRKSKLKESD
jgi:hypothetical protein